MFIYLAVHLRYNNTMCTCLLDLNSRGRGWDGEFKASRFILSVNEGIWSGDFLKKIHHHFYEEFLFLKTASLPDLSLNPLMQKPT